MHCGKSVKKRKMHPIIWFENYFLIKVKYIFSIIQSVPFFLLHHSVFLAEVAQRSFVAAVAAMWNTVE